MFHIFLTLLVSHHALAAGSTVTITEIAAQLPSDHEWVEIHNTNGAPVDLTGWTFLEDATKHKLTIFRGTYILASDEYAIIANKADVFAVDYPEYAGTIFDSSWSSLKEGGEEIGLFDGTKNEIERFTYPAVNTSETPNPHSAPTTTDTATTGTPLPDPLPEPVPEIAVVPETSDQVPTDTLVSEETIESTAAPTSIPQLGTLYISEFMPDPSSGPEWIELYNANTFSVDLAGWTIADNSNSITHLAGIIAPLAYLVIEDPKGALNNTGDIVVLKDPSENVYGQVAYGAYDDGNTADNPPAPAEGHAIMRMDTGTYALTTTPTKNEVNIYTPEVSKPTTSSETTASSPASTSTLSRRSALLIISELFPNPPGDDLNYEYIELYNQGPDVVETAGWFLRDSKKTTYTLSAQSVLPGKFLALERSTTHIALDNDGDTVRLYTPEEKLADHLTYTEDVPEGIAVMRSGTKILLTATPTRDAANLYTEIPQPPVAEIVCETAGPMVICDASDSYDPNGDEIGFLWSIDGHTFAAPRFEYPATRSKVEATVTISDGALTTQKTKKITVDIPDAVVPKKDTVSAVKKDAPARTASTTKIEGTVTKKTARTITLATDTEFYRITFPTSISPPAVSVGTRLQARGVAKNTKTGWTLRVSDLSDIETLRDPTPTAQEPATIPPRTDNTHTLIYLGGAAMLTAGVQTGKHLYKKKKPPNAALKHSTYDST